MAKFVSYDDRFRQSCNSFVWEEQTNRERLDRLNKALPLAIEMLNNKQKIYIKHKFYDNMKVIEIAAMYNVQPSTVSRSIARGKKRLEQYLKFAL